MCEYNDIVLTSRSTHSPLLLPRRLHPHTLASISSSCGGHRRQHPLKTLVREMFHMYYAPPVPTSQFRLCRASWANNIVPMAALRFISKIYASPDPLYNKILPANALVSPLAIIHSTGTLLILLRRARQRWPGINSLRRHLNPCFRLV